MQGELAMWHEPFERLVSGFVGLDQETDLNELEGELQSAGWYVGRCDATMANDKATLINAIAMAMGFPEWTGRNWDALSDALTDLGWIDQSHVALVLDGLDAVKSASPADWRMSREILLESAEWWESNEKTLIVLFA